MSNFANAISRLEIEAEKPGRMILRDFNGKPLIDDDGSMNYIDVYSYDSAVARKHDKALRNRRLQMRGRVKVTAEEVDAEVLDLFVAITAGWGSISEDGKEIADADFSADAARKLYADPKHSEIRAQVDEFAAERANFSKASPKT